MDFHILDCCGYEVRTDKPTRKYIDFYKSNDFYKNKLKDGREIKKEYVLTSVCPVCTHRIIKFLWYLKKMSNYYNWDESLTVRGIAADEIFERKNENYVLSSLPRAKDKNLIKCCAKNSWVYGKTLDGATQVPRYINESANAGRKIYIPVIKSGI